MSIKPTWIIISRISSLVNRFSVLLKEAAEKKDVPVLLTSRMEAEAIKLFSNTYLAMRVSLFN